MKTKKYCTPRQELMSNEKVEHPQIQKFINKWGYNYIKPYNHCNSQQEISRSNPEKKIYHLFSLSPADSNLEKMFIGSKK